MPWPLNLSWQWVIFVKGLIVHNVYRRLSKHQPRQLRIVDRAMVQISLAKVLPLPLEIFGLAEPPPCLA